LRAPAQICEATSTPRAPPAKRSSTLQSSSSVRPGTTAARSAQSRSTGAPVTNSAMLNACVPMSPMQPPTPA
jgi:hypothetical protein